MEQSIFLAQIFGPMMIVIGISLMFNMNYFSEIVKEMRKSHMLIYIGGLMSMFLWLYILISIENQGYLFQFILLAFGVLATIKWVLLLLFPKYMKKTTKDITFLFWYLPYIGVAYAILGWYLCYASYSFF